MTLSSIIRVEYTPLVSSIVGIASRTLWPLLAVLVATVATTPAPPAPSPACTYAGGMALAHVSFSVPSQLHGQAPCLGLRLETCVVQLACVGLLAFLMRLCAFEGFLL